MMEQTDSGKCHCHIVFVTGFDNIVITDGTTRLCHICHTTSMCTLDIIPKWEECIRSKRHICVFI